MIHTKPASSPHLRPSPDDVRRLLAGEHHDPHSVLGAHEYDDHTVIRAYRPHALEVCALIGGDRYVFTSLGDGLFAVALPFTNLLDYRLEVRYPGPDGSVSTYTVADAYRFLPTLGEMDLHLFGEGRHERLWEVLGAHPRRYNTPDGVVEGVSFAVWAPNAKGVSLIGDFNGWNGNEAQLRVLGSSGVWELFWPDFPVGGLYKFRVHGADGSVTDRADPMAFATEVPPQTASKVTVSDYRWHDDEWLARRAERNPISEPMSTYEVHLMSWRPGLSYRELAHQLAEYVVEQGFTHVELMPVAEHPFGGSWGYQVTSYYAPTARLGEPDDFRYLVDTLHQAGIGVIMDWVPAHFPKDAWALGRFDGTALYEHSDPRRGEQLDWGTYVFDFGRPEVRNFLVANALYWLQEFHIDGLRVDAVASMLYLDYSRPSGAWTPNIYGGRENLEAVQFLQEMNATVHKLFPGVVTIAEESTSWPGVTRPTTLGGLGFSMKWNMGWMNDTLQYIKRDPIYRSYHHHEMTFSMLYAYSENFVLPISHDEVVHGKGTLWGRMPGDDHTKAAGVRELLAYQWAHPGKQLLFMGQEFGQRAEWSEERGLDWFQLDESSYSIGIQRLVRDLNRIYRSTRALWSLDTSPQGYSWIDANDSANNVLSFLRYGDDGSVLACVFNFAGVEHTRYRVGLPYPGTWREVLNTDADGYHGSGIGNYGAVQATDEPWHGRPASAVMVLPPLAALWFEYAGDGEG
ncbi:1,4-alpha-glucan branching enzyme [Mycolicibacterium hassiacum DSM 44199]|uniref:1,4-alpha-glucan branching enzyme GlgB n=1 Tax=Mycolicibacterium hassiacum (strain DSM 44199 / CIP 105218 / JCM 12690 / 3849) TaxID=1122247 RepID=K5BD60_MYCHD|nr:1,4-alpha-glucan branching protein GlgB [Mycolicibacterium hassiacum]EKF25695.1 1,4-alpha-glucan branching enzyme [Mycolicibacterium hassiacum DSM 44199]MBX5485408.1 1,4-alpha-glucan branching protein GlgB [Mycolicibacterium hassiacum]MDA4084612.1 glycogen branching protein [Mycolicibacterium hassiacum DSM 44199]PZN23477.1 MAG: 1,4-alpha-glucan branching protein GlgB [Mycolicibacterium hassiacum]VCT90968.1 1,4-alpha-glucan branching enzyme GlgB [Mycolicibacterium hassiacum DSM 44199]